MQNKCTFVSKLTTICTLQVLLVPVLVASGDKLRGEGAPTCVPAAAQRQLRGVCAAAALRLPAARQLQVCADPSQVWSDGDTILQHFCRVYHTGSIIWRCVTSLRQTSIVEAGVRLLQTRLASSISACGSCLCRHPHA